MDPEVPKHSGYSPSPQKGFVERRVAQTDRRVQRDRRRGSERRNDTRLSPVKQPKTLKQWVRSVIHLRLGVDRRKNHERRSPYDRRQSYHPSSLLSPEELADLLS
ncbi:MAG: hypothetical protein AB7E77_12390 [Desulfobulbus sp.]